MKDNPSITLLGTAFQTIDEHGKLLTHYYPPTTHKEIINSFTSYCPIAHSSVIFQRLPDINLGPSFRETPNLWTVVRQVYLMVPKKY